MIKAECHLNKQTSSQQPQRQAYLGGGGESFAALLSPGCASVASDTSNRVPGNHDRPHSCIAQISCLLTPRDVCHSFQNFSPGLKM